MFHEKTSHAAKGKWRGILLELGIPSESLTGRHSPCPLCGSKDNFRWDNQDGRGTYICTCGAGDGMKLALEFTGEGFSSIAPRIDAMLGNIKPEPAGRRVEVSEDDRKTFLRETVAETQPVVPGDLVHRYLESRGVGERIYPPALRFGARLRDGEGGVRPCMVALVGVYGQTDPKGRQRYCTLHRTFLRPDGLGKAEMAAPRKLMPGELPDGACVMLSEWTGSGPIGIAEGIETAMAASAMFDLPVWAAINATMLTKWTPPPGADEVAIFADNDERFGGQAAAYTLAHRIRTARATRDIPVTVHVPLLTGSDWNDELLKQRGAQ